MKDFLGFTRPIGPADEQEMKHVWIGNGRDLLTSPSTYVPGSPLLLM